MGDKTDCRNFHGMAPSCHLHTESNSCIINAMVNEIVIINMDYIGTSQFLIRSFTILIVFGYQWNMLDKLNVYT